MAVSSLTTADMLTVAALVDFVRGPGYVLNFSDREFTHFFGREINIDIDDIRFTNLGTSKGKRLRRFLELTDNATARKTLEALWAVRTAFLADTNQSDPVGNSLQRFNALVNRLGGLSGPQPSTPKPSKLLYNGLQDQLLSLSGMAPHPRGYAFQKFLYELFESNGTDPRTSFRNKGEEIDGSFVSETNVYLLEAKWEAKPVAAAPLHAFEGKINQKSPWTRGLFISYSGFSADGLSAFGRGKRTICMDGADLYEMLVRGLTLDQVLAAKTRKAGETGSPFVVIKELF